MDYIALSKTVQGQGLGPKFMKYLLDEYKDKIIVLECEDHLVKFYEKNNFNRIKLSYTAGIQRLNLLYYGKIQFNEPFEIKNFMEGIYLKKSDFTYIFTIPKINFTINLKKSQYKYHIVDHFNN